MRTKKEESEHGLLSRYHRLSTTRHRPILSPTALRPSLPPALDRICLRFLQPDPGERYARSTELADDLRGFGWGGPG